MIDKVLNTIKKHNLIEYGDGIVVGLSGGPDSVCLVHVLKKLSEMFGARIFAVHINHMLRHEEADADEEYCRELCRKLDVPFYSVKVDIASLAAKKGLSIEEAGREERYEQFNRWADWLGAAKIAVAHNRNDQAETVLMHIIRGTGIDGLKGMDYARGRIIRPLLDIDRSEIEAYCRENELYPRTDKSNLKSIYTRNRIRLELMPYLKEHYNPAIVDSILRLAGCAREDAEFLDKTALEMYNSCRVKNEEGLVGLDASMLSRMSRAMSGRVVRYAIRDLKGDLKGIESVHIRDVIELCSGRTGSELHLPGKLRARNSYGVLEIYLSEEDKNINFEALLKIPGCTRVPEAGCAVETRILEPKDIEQYRNMGYNSLVQFFDYDLLKTGIYLRNRRNGDIFKPFKGKGTKKLKEYLIDAKIPRHERRRLPLIAKNNEIVWIVGHKISDKFKVTENTNTVLSIRFIKL